MPAIFIQGFEPSWGIIVLEASSQELGKGDPERLRGLLGGGVFLARKTDLCPHHDNGVESS